MLTSCKAQAEACQLRDAFLTIAISYSEHAPNIISDTLLPELTGWLKKSITSQLSSDIPVVIAIALTSP
jgi:hypothetical protein